MPATTVGMLVRQTLECLVLLERVGIAVGNIGPDRIVHNAERGSVSSCGDR